MIETKGYTIWIEPRGDLLKRFSGVIANLAEKFGTPTFTPHLTILGGIEQPLDVARARTADLAKNTNPFKIDLTGKIDYQQDNWTRTMVVLAQDNPEILELYRRSLEAFRMNRPPIEPHISLLYSETASLQSKQEAAQEFDPQQFKTKLEVATLSLVSVNGKIEDWKKIEDFPLAT